MSVQMVEASVEPLANSAPVAQWIEHLTSDQMVGGSNPSGRATLTIDRTVADAISGR